MMAAAQAAAEAALQEAVAQESSQNNSHNQQRGASSHTNYGGGQAPGVTTRNDLALSIEALQHQQQQLMSSAAADPAAAEAAGLQAQVLQDLFGIEQPSQHQHQQQQPQDMGTDGGVLGGETTNHTGGHSADQLLHLLASEDNRQPTAMVQEQAMNTRPEEHYMTIAQNGK